MSNLKLKLAALISITVLSAIALLFTGPIAQDINYHRFCDTRQFASIPNFFNVTSNFLFLVFGSAGLFLVLYLREKNVPDFLFPAHVLFFSGIFLTGIGSAWYHLDPTSETLLWDRLPMTLTFMAFFSGVISEYINLRIGRKLLIHFTFVGIISVVYWYKTEQAGHGDLRFYILVQFLPMLLIPLILLLFGRGGPRTGYYWAIIGVYAIAKSAEQFDCALFHNIQYISGHSLKHLIASTAPFIYILKIWQLKTKPLSE